MLNKFNSHSQCKTNNEGGVGDYATIHITPEPEFSYVSFETNIATENYMDLVIKVVDTFKPNKLIVTFYATRVKTDEESYYIKLTNS